MLNITSIPLTRPVRFSSDSIDIDYITLRRELDLPNSLKTPKDLAPTDWLYIIKSLREEGISIHTEGIEFERNGAYKLTDDQQIEIIQAFLKLKKDSNPKVQV